MGELLRKQDHQDWVRDFLGGGEREEAVEDDTQTCDLGNGGVCPERRGYGKRLESEVTRDELLHLRCSKSEMSTGL